MIALWVFLGSLVSGLLMLFLFRGTLASERLSRTNFRGVKLPTAAGVVFAPAFLLVWIPVMDYAVRNLLNDSQSMMTNFRGLRTGIDSMLILVLGFCLLGLIDDVAGDSGARGFKGHFSEGLHGSFTTGLVKAFLGFVVAMVAMQPWLYIAGRMNASAYATWVMNAALVALTANLFNLLDLRPGRALKVFFPALALCAGLTLRFETLAGGGFMLPYAPLYFYVTPALSIAAIALVLFPGDLREKFMLGDVGSNVLGAVIGLGLVLGTSFWWRLGVLILVLILNILSEKYSFSKAISSNRALNWIDSLGRKGQEATGANNN
ncbi:MAG TPA: hypothetical protein VIK15_01275 [Candidatus Anoxymicrobiaceae bacterium]